MFATRPLHPRKPTCRARLVMSQKCQERTQTAFPANTVIWFPCSPLRDRIPESRAAIKMRWREFVAGFGDEAIYSWEEVVAIYSMLSCETRQSQRPLRMRFL